MSYTARPSFTSGSGQNQQQQRNQQNASNNQTGGIPNMSMINNPTAATPSMQSSNLSSSSGTSVQSVIEYQKLLQHLQLMQGKKCKRIIFFHQILCVHQYLSDIC